MVKKAISKAIMYGRATKAKKANMNGSDPPKSVKRKTTPRIRVETKATHI